MFRRNLFLIVALFFLLSCRLSANNTSLTTTLYSMTPEASITEGMHICNLPISIGMMTRVLLPTPPPKRQNAFNKATVAATANAVAASSVVSLAVVSPVAVAQSSRGVIALSLSSCEDNTTLETDPLAWSDSPTGLSLGQDEFSYYRGAIVGNWIFFTGVTATYSAAAALFGCAKLRYPGALVLPALFLTTPTSSSAVRLYRFGNPNDIALAVSSLTAQTLASAGLIVFLLPFKFKADWDENKLRWMDSDQADYVHRYGMLFKDYRQYRQWFIGFEFLFSIAAGALEGYDTRMACSRLLAAGSSFYGTYAGAAVFLHPSKNKFDRVYLIFVSSSQFLSVLASSVGGATNSSKLQEIGNSLAVATQWVITARSFYDLFKQGKSLIKYFRSRFFWYKAPILAQQNTDILSSLINVQADGPGNELDEILEALNEHPIELDQLLPERVSLVPSPVSDIEDLLPPPAPPLSPVHSESPPPDSPIPEIPMVIEEAVPDSMILQFDAERRAKNDEEIDKFMNSLY